MFCLLLYIMEGSNPERLWMFSIASLIIPASFIINTLLIFFWIFVQWRSAWLPFVVILAGITQLQKFVAINSDNTLAECDKTESFKIMSYNLYGLKNLKDSTDKNLQNNKLKFLSFLRKNDPDILCVQENNLFSDDVITKAELFPYFHYLINHGAAIYSKFPILDQGLIDFGTNTNSCLWADVLIHGRRLRVYSMHLQSNAISKQMEMLTEEDKELQTQKINIFKQMLIKYRRMSLKRAKQAESVNLHASQSPNPVILAGDFNDTPFSYVYKILSEHRKDSFLEFGNGFGSTLVGVLPGLRIDYILGDSKKVNFCSHKVLQSSFSDHNPIISKVYIK